MNTVVKMFGLLLFFERMALCVVKLATLSTYRNYPHTNTSLNHDRRWLVNLHRLFFVLEITQLIPINKVKRFQENSGIFFFGMYPHQLALMQQNNKNRTGASA